jgi:hypothetical protein
MAKLGTTPDQVKILEYELDALKKVIQRNQELTFQLNENQKHLEIIYSTVLVSLRKIHDGIAITS